MNSTQKVLIALIRSQISDYKPDITELSEKQLYEVLNVAAEHDMTNVVSKALLDFGIVSDENVAQQLFAEQYGGVLRYQQQKYALERMCCAFENDGICYIPLKGSVIRDLYPEPELRTSSDIDVLVKKEDLESAARCLENNLGCEYFKRTSHDISFVTDNGVHIELHHTLSTDKYAFVMPLGAAWDNASPTSGYRYDFSNEFFVYYHYAHMAKHFVKGGFGIRFVLDLWLMMQKMTWDEQKLSAMLCDGGIKKMADVVRRLALVWFYGEVHDENTAVLEEYIFDSGIYGTLENNVVISQRQQSGKLANLINRVFMPREKLMDMYPKLEKYSWLYPWYLVVRFFRIVFKNRDKALTELKLNQTADSLKTKKINKLFDMLDIR